MSVNPVNSLLQPGAPRAAGEGRQGLREAASEFESLFINQMLKSMRETITKSELFHGGNAEDIYTSMLDSELSKNMASSGGIGLADMLLRQLDNGEGEGPVTQEPSRPSQIRDVAPTVRQTTPAPVAAPVAPVVQPVTEPAAKPVIQTTEEPADEKFSFPLKELKRISSEFGERVDPITGKTRFHHGMDIAARAGTPVYPASKGTVIFSGVKGGYGNMVEILHDDGLVTRYGHNAKNFVREGEIVTPSEPIASVGSTGRSTGPHLHFEVLKDGRALDPGSLYAVA